MKKLLVGLLFLFLIGIAPLARAEVFDVMADASVNTNVSSVSYGQLSNSAVLCSKFKVWENSLTYDLVIYLGDPTDSTTMYYTVPAGTTATIDYLIPAQKDEGIYIAATCTADATVNFISFVKKGYK